MLIFTSGCFERNDPITALGSTSKADEALKKAETILEKIGITFTLKDPGGLTNPEDLVPNLGNVLRELGSVEKEMDLEEAVVQLNIVLSELEQEAKGESSLSDMAMVHFYLGITYLLDAVSRFLISDDPEETFIIEYDPKSPSGKWFAFDISMRVKVKLVLTDNPLDYPLIFTLKERQAFIDAADLIGDTKLKPRAPNIQPQSSSVDRPPFLKSALWHLEQAVNFAQQYSPDLVEIHEEFNRNISDLEDTIRQDSVDWGYTYILPPWR